MCNLILLQGTKMCQNGSQIDQRAAKRRSGSQAGFVSPFFRVQGYSFSSFWRHFLKTSVHTENQHKITRPRSRKGFAKDMILIPFRMSRGSVRIGGNRALAPCLLQFKRFRRHSNFRRLPRPARRAAGQAGWAGWATAAAAAAANVVFYL